MDQVKQIIFTSGCFNKVIDCFSNCFFPLNFIVKGCYHYYPFVNVQSNST